MWKFVRFGWNFLQYKYRQTIVSLFKNYFPSMETLPSNQFAIRYQWHDEEYEFVSALPPRGPRVYSVFQVKDNRHFDWTKEVLRLLGPRYDFHQKQWTLQELYTFLWKRNFPHYPVPDKYSLTFILFKFATHEYFQCIFEDVTGTVAVHKDMLRKECLKSLLPDRKIGLV